MCCVLLQSKELFVEANSSVDTLFTFEGTRLVYNKIQRLDTLTVTEISLMSVVRPLCL